MNEISEMLDMLNDMIGKFAEHPTLVTNLAKANAKMRSALMAEGFTREEALRIMVANPLKFTK